MKSLLNKLLLTLTVCLGYNSVANAQWTLDAITPLGQARGSKNVGTGIETDFVAGNNVVLASATAKSTPYMVTQPLPPWIAQAGGPTTHQVPTTALANASVYAEWTVYYAWKAEDAPPGGTVLSTVTGRVTGSVLGELTDLHESSSEVSVPTTSGNLQGKATSLSYDKPAVASISFQYVAGFEKAAYASMSASANARALAGALEGGPSSSAKAKAESSFGAEARVL